MSDAAASPAEEPELMDLVKRGLQWSFAGTAAVRIGTFVAGLIMARVLSPHDYGIYTVGAVALLLTASINDIGIEPTLIRWPGNLKEVAPTAITIVMSSSFVLFGLFWFLAPDFARMLNAPGATGIVRFMSVGIIISGAFTVPSAVNAREFRQHIRMIGEVSGTFVTIGLTLVLGLAGAGPVSLAVGHIAGNLTVGLVLFIGSPSHFRPGWNRAAAKQLVVLGLPLAGVVLIGNAIENVDYLVVGSVLGTTALGFYMLAWNLSSWPINLFSAAVNRVSVPAFRAAPTRSGGVDHRVPSVDPSRGLRHLAVLRPPRRACGADRRLPLRGQVVAGRGSLALPGWCRRRAGGNAPGHGPPRRRRVGARDVRLAGVVARHPHTRIGDRGPPRWHRRSRSRPLRGCALRRHARVRLRAPPSRRARP